MGEFVSPKVIQSYVNLINRRYKSQENFLWLKDPKQFQFLKNSIRLHKSKGNGQTKLGIGILEDMKNEKFNLNLIETRPKVFGK